MQSSTPISRDHEHPPTPVPSAFTEPEFIGEPRPIAELTVQPGFPQSALGAYVDIRGFAGVVVEIVNQSIKVRSPEGITQRFNANRLKTLYAPPDRSEPVTMMIPDRPRRPASPEPDETPAGSPPRTFIAEPDFTAPMRSIEEVAGRPDFPECAYGQYLDIQGYSGVVVEIVRGSLKVQSAEGVTRSYNGIVLKKLHGSARKPV